MPPLAIGFSMPSLSTHPPTLALKCTALGPLEKAVTAACPAALEAEAAGAVGAAGVGGAAGGAGGAGGAAADNPAVEVVAVGSWSDEVVPGAAEGGSEAATAAAAAALALPLALPLPLAPPPAAATRKRWREDEA